MDDLSTNTFQNGKSFKLKRCPFCPTGKGGTHSGRARTGRLYYSLCIRALRQLQSKHETCYILGSRAAR